MIFQKVLKGIAGIDPTDDAESDKAAKNILRGVGILCNWWIRVKNLPEIEIRQKLTPRNLFWHLEHYDDHDPVTGARFCENTPYISTTAGCVERDGYRGVNHILSPFITALRFATDGFTRRGYVFYAYVLIIGKQSIPIREFAEEVRELHIYTSFLRYQPEGEIVAKISIPSVRLERVECYEPARARLQLRKGNKPTPEWVEINPNFQPPERFNNVREVLP
jgi:hypothetical protein